MAGKLKTHISNVLCIIFDYSLIYVGIYVNMNSLHEFLTSPFCIFNVKFSFRLTFSSKEFVLPTSSNCRRTF